MSFFRGTGGSDIHHPKRDLTNPDADKGSNLILHVFLLVLFVVVCTMVIRHHEKPLQFHRSYFLSSLRIYNTRAGWWFQIFYCDILSRFFSVRN